jgi:hypothetical protein
MLPLILNSFLIFFGLRGVAPQIPLTGITFGPILPSQCSPNNGLLYYLTTTSPPTGPYWCDSVNTWIYHGGTIGSIGLSLPPQFCIANSPVVTNGTLLVTFCPGALSGNGTTIQTGTPTGIPLGHMAVGDGLGNLVDGGLPGPPPSTPSMACVPASGPITVGVVWSTICTEQNGTFPAVWSISSGSLPAGISSCTSVGAICVLTGTPTTSGSYSFTVQDVDAGSHTLTQSFSGNIANVVQNYCLQASTGLPAIYPGTVVPTLPASCPTVSFPTSNTQVPFSGTTMAQLQTAVNALTCGQTLVIPHTLNLSGTSLLIPGTICTATNQIGVISDAMANLPPTGQQVQLSQLSNMPTIESSTLSAAMGLCQVPTCSTAPAYWYFAGLNFTTVNVGSAGSPNYVIVAAGIGPTLMTQVANHIVFDRIIVQGNGMTVHGIYADIANFVLINSQIVGIIDTNADTQTVIACATTGPILISNNHLEASTENIMFGGCPQNGLPPTDLTVTHNYLHKPQAWYGQLYNITTGQPASTGTLLDIKNSLECKNCIRALFDSNIMDYAVNQGQGTCFSNNSFLQTSGGGWQVQDVTWTNNLCMHAGGGAYVSSNNQTSAAQTARVMMRNNIFFDVNTTWGGSPPITPSGVALLGGSGGGGITNFTFDHNTTINIVTPPATNSHESIYFNGETSLESLAYLTVTNNLGYGPLACDGNYPSTCLITYLPSTGVYKNNLHVGDQFPYSCDGCGNFTPAYPTADKIYQAYSSAIPPGGTIPCNYLVSGAVQPACVNLNWALVGFLDVTGGLAGTDLPGLALTSSSPYYVAATDGTALGANIAAVLSAVSGVQ